jgi:hypothetical protein
MLGCWESGRSASGALSAVLIVRAFCLQEFSGSDKPQTLHLLVNNSEQFLQEGFDFLVGGQRVSPCGRNLGTDVADPVIEPACEHKGRARS